MKLHLVTAIHANLSDHFAATASSVEDLRQHLKSMGVSVYWHVVVDGVGEAPARPDGVTTWQVVGAQVGVATARNLALSSTGGDGWVFRLDGDDTIDVDGWKDLLSDERFGQTSWHPTNLVDEHGNRTQHWFSESKVWRPRELEEHWSSLLPFHPNNVVARADLVLATGGWPALRVGSGVLWCFGLNQHEPGLALPYVTLRYRKWGHQTVAQDRYVSDKSDVFAFTEAVTNARRQRSGLGPIAAPPAGPSALYAPPCETL